MIPNDGLTTEQRAALAALLGKTLADEYVLYTKTRNYHWNVEGPLFNDLHKFFEAQYTQLEATVDEAAEYIRFLGHTAPGTLAEFLALARLSEHPGAKLAAREMVASLLDSHEALIRHTRADIQAAEAANSPEIADFLTGLIQQHQKMAWMLRSMAN